MAEFFLDPTGDGSPFNFFGSYTDVDDGIRQPAAQTTVDSLDISSGDVGDEARLTYTLPAVSGTITSLEGWQVAPSGKPQYGIILNGTDLGLKSTQDTTASGSWYGYSYTGLSTAITGATVVTRHVCSSDEDDEIYATYIRVTYTPGSDDDLNPEFMLFLE